MNKCAQKLQVIYSSLQEMFIPYDETVWRPAGIEKIKGR